MKIRQKLKYPILLTALCLTCVFQSLYLFLRSENFKNSVKFGKTLRKIQMNILSNDLLYSIDKVRKNWTFSSEKEHSASVQKNEWENPTDVYFSEYFSINKQPLATWINKSNTQYMCDKVTVFAGRYAIGHDILMFPKRRQLEESQAKGGEQIKDVLHQEEHKENYNFNKDFWEVICETESEIKNLEPFYWSKSIKLISGMDNGVQSILKGMKNETRYTIGVRRQDYANLHNWVRNIYNTFLTMIHLKIRPSDILILFLDGHPFTYLDHAWAKIFNEPIRVGHLTEPIRFKNFIWGFQENRGPITEQNEVESVPYLEEFREFVLSTYRLSNRKYLDCKNLQITFIIRRNAVYHPRNIAGNVGRKIFNEAEIVDTLMNTFPKANVRSVLMESLPMKKQLEIASQTDLWIGMHGAGMSHLAFLPKHAAVLELFSRGFKTNRPWYICFHSLTTWRGIKYDSWENLNGELEMPHDFTIVPVDDIAKKTVSLVKQICPNM